MKITLNIFVFIFLVMTIGCSENEPQKSLSWEADIQKKCTDTLKYFLNDPDSYQGAEWMHKKISYQDYLDLQNKYPDYKYKYWNWLFIHRYRAKNKFGGYVPGVSFFLVDSLDNIEISKKSGLPSYVDKSNLPDD